MDEAGREMTDLNIAVRKMTLRFEDLVFSISITIGVEENDFQSTMEQILDRADRKLYMGKVGGRDRVVVYHYSAALRIVFRPPSLAQ